MFRRDYLPPSLSITNILQALYEDSPTIKMYVDCIADGRPVPYTLITKSTEHEKNEEIVGRLKANKADFERILPTLRDSEIGFALDIINECLDEAMILEEEKYNIIMYKGYSIVEGSTQTVTGNKIGQLQEYARFKGYEISIKKV